MFVGRRCPAAEMYEPDEVTVKGATRTRIEVAEVISEIIHERDYFIGLFSLDGAERRTLCAGGACP